jgi:hypothetical protein
MAIDVKQAFNDFKSRLELSATLQKAITTHHNAIREWIESYDSNIETKLIGSLQRKTRIQPRAVDTFDIDILVILGYSTKWVTIGGITPKDALDKIENIVSKHETYNRIGPEADSPTIVINYTDNTKVELVPAYIDNIGQYPNGMLVFPKGRGYWIPQRNNWVLADYDYDAEFISNKNKECEGWLIPTIKMLKAAKRNLFPEMKSYHLEVLATSIIPLLVEHYKNQNFQLSFPGLIYGFFFIAKDEVLNSCSIKGSKSPDASAYMTYNQKQKLTDKFSKIANYCKSIIKLDGRDGIEGWRKLFGEPFPSYG